MILPCARRNTFPINPVSKTLSALSFFIIILSAFNLSSTFDPPKIITNGDLATVRIFSSCFTSLSTNLPAHVGRTCANPTNDGCVLCALGNESSTNKSNRSFNR